MPVDQAGTADPLSIYGVVPPTVTAFNGAGDLDLERTAAHAEFVVERGAHAVFPLGTNGEYPLLTGPERDAVVGAVVEAVGENVPVLAGVGTPGTRRTIERAKAAVEAGADGCFVVTPYYYELDDRGAIEHYRAVDAAVDVPIYAYQIPPLTGTQLTRETVRTLAEEGTIVGIKDSSRDMPWLGQVVAENPELSVLVGSDTLQHAGIATGCSGAVSAVANVFPELVADCYGAAARGDHDRARTLQRRLFEVRSALAVGDAPMAGVKAALEIRGVPMGDPRGPLRGMDESAREELRDRLDGLGLLE